MEPTCRYVFDHVFIEVLSASWGSVGARYLDHRVQMEREWSQSVHTRIS
jgi:hypothetical protein